MLYQLSYTPKLLTLLAFPLPRRHRNTPLLPICYRNCLGAVYSSPDRGVNLCRSVLLHAGQDVAVEVERDAYA